MVGFFIKKSFFDGWDNFLSLILSNIVYIALCVGALGALSMESLPQWALVLILALALFLGDVYTGGVTGLTHQYARYSREGWACFKESCKKQFSHSVLHFVIMSIVVASLFLVIPFYLRSIGGMAGALLAAVVFWVVIFAVLALQYFFPLAQMMDKDGPFKTLRKCFLILGDNLGFSVFLALYTVVDFVLSVLFALMMPGFAGIHLSRSVAMKLLMLKYDYLEAHPGLDRRERRRIPWDDLLVDEREKVGRRTLRGMIFPWKD